jgi:hypothetical protein
MTERDVSRDLRAWRKIEMSKLKEQHDDRKARLEMTNEYRRQEIQQCKVRIQELKELIQDDNVELNAWYARQRNLIVPHRSE